MASEVVKCESCGREILPRENGLTVDYVWRDGHTYCNECNRKKATEARK